MNTKFQIVGISGKAGSGKDWMIQNYLRPAGFYQISLAWHFKVWLVGQGKATFEEVFHTKPPHIRELLQLEGTERGRNVFGEDVWLDTAYAWMELWNETWGIDKFVIGDVRFVNEAEKIKSWGGKVARIYAPVRVANSKLTAEQRLHPSETAFDDYDSRDPETYKTGLFDQVINNDHVGLTDIGRFQLNQLMLRDADLPGSPKTPVVTTFEDGQLVFCVKRGSGTVG